MSREIKFRAWDKGRKEFLSAGQILLAINPNRYPKSTDFYLDVCNEKYKNMWRDRFEIQQFTGVFDKNVREIYEGDIVKRKMFDDCVIGQVVWVNVGFCGFMLKCGNSYYHIGKSEHTGISDCDEVIGNVYENADLLRGGVCKNE